MMCFSSSFVSRQKKKNQEEKIKATSPGLLRNGRSGAVKPNSLRFTTLTQGFPTPPDHSSAHAPPPRPVFLLFRFLMRQDASLLVAALFLLMWHYLITNDVS